MSSIVPSVRFFCVGSIGRAIQASASFSYVRTKGKPALLLLDCTLSEVFLCSLNRECDTSFYELDPTLSEGFLCS